MENMFITKDNINGKFRPTYDFKFWTMIGNFLNGEIDYETEYRDWVYQWRAYEKDLVSAIKFFRKLKNEAEFGDAFTKNTYQGHKLFLRAKATQFYNARKEKKENFKKSEFFVSWSINRTEQKEKELC